MVGWDGVCQLQAMVCAGSGCWPENAALYAVSDEDEGEINRQKCASGRAVNTLWASAWLRCEEEPFNSNGTA